MDDEDDDIDYDALNPEIRAHALVGRFLQSWAIMEGQLKSCIAKALNLTPMQEAIVTNNIQLRDKIHILRTIVDLSYISPDSERARFKKILKDISAYSTTRNMVAHDGFGATKDGKAVQFLIVKAKGSLEFPDEIWDLARFRQEYATILAYATALARLKDALSAADLFKAFLAAKQKQPMEGTSEPIRGGLLDLLLRGGPDSGNDQPTPIQEPQTPPSEPG